jgi:hypothetical protein
VTEALHAVIPHSGQEAASEALDWLRRARRQP